MHLRRILLVVAAGLALVGAEPAPDLWDVSDLKVSKPEDKKDVKVVPAPSGAIVLLDENSGLSGWSKVGSKDAPSWKQLADGVVQVQGGNIRTRREYKGPFKLHVEFRVPYMPKASGQGRGNSGVYVQGRYEVQVLDSYGLKSKDNDCGGIYGVAAPKVNACKAPAVWQSYDIDFTPPVCEDGKITKPGRMTVHQNGILIHDDVALADRNGKPVTNTTAGLGGDPCKPGPIMLQDHGNPVQYRNIWLLPGTSDHETVMKGMVEQMNLLADALASVTDKATAKTAAVKINKVCDRMKELGQEAKSLPKLGKAEEAKLQKKYESEIKKATERLIAVAAKAGAASGGEPDFLKSLKRLQEVGSELQKLGQKSDRE